MLLIVLYFFLTLFCLLVIVCHISAARPPFSTFVLVSQVYTAPFQLQGISKERYAAAWEVFEPSRAYLHGQHLLLCFAAFACALVFCILPFTILFLYPFKCFQKCLNCCGLRCLTLHAFADAFQGCYKDGTDGSRDYRWFAGVHLFIRFGIVLLFSLLKNYFLFSLYVSFISFALVAATAILQPYKKDINNKIDTLLVFAMGVFYFGLPLSQR